MAYIIDDLSTNTTYDAADRFDLENTLNDIFARDETVYKDLDDNTNTIGEIIDELVKKVIGREYTGDEEAFLNVTIQEQ